MKKNLKTRHEYENIFLIIYKFLVLPLISWNSKAVTIENTSFGIDIGDVLIYKIIDASDTDVIGHKLKFTIENVYRGNSSVIYLFETTWMGAIMNVSQESWNKTTGKWKIGITSATLAYNATTKNFKAGPNWLFVLPTPLNLSFMADHFNNLEYEYEECIRNQTATFSDNTLNITQYEWYSDSLSSILKILYTYNDQGIATRLEWRDSHDEYFTMILELESDDGSSIPSGFTFIGIACVSIAAVVIIVRKRTKTK